MRLTGSKLRGRSWRELRVRGAQELAKLSERYFGSDAQELTDRQLQHAFTAVARKPTARESVTALIERWRKPQEQRFFPALKQRAGIIALMETRFPVERAAILARADRVLTNRFDIFEYKGEPEGLSFGEPVDWQLEPTTGKRTPLLHWSKLDFLNPEVAGDKKFTWELNRHQFFVTLGQAYWLTSDERYAAKFVELATAWLDANPPKRGINWASSLELSFRVIAWLWALHLFAEAKALTPEFVTRLLKSLIAQGRYIETYLSHYFSPNTHLTGEALGLFYLGVALPELQQAEHWQQCGLQILLEQLPRQVRRDGVYFEQASYYHRYTTDFYTHLSLLCRAHNIKLPPVVEEKLTALYEHLCWVTRPDGSATFYGDDDGGRLVMLSTRNADDFRDTLATGAALFQRGEWKYVAGEASIETLWLLGAHGLKAFDDLAAQPPAMHTKAFAESGFYVLRDGWERTSSYLFIDCGPHGVMNGGHAHSDALSFEFAAQGVTWLVDPGTYTYTRGAEERVAFTSSLGHNTVAVDGLSQSVKLSAFTWSHVAQVLPLEFSETATGWQFTGQQNGYARLTDPVRQQRQFLWQCGAITHLVLRDRFTAKSTHRYELRLHFAAGLQASVGNGHIHVTAPDGKGLILVTIATSAHSSTELSPTVGIRLEEGWVSRCYGQRELAPLAINTLEAQGSCELRTLIVPFNQQQKEEVERFVTQWVLTENSRPTEQNKRRDLATV